MRRASLALLALGLVLVLAACGGGDAGADRATAVDASGEAATLWVTLDRGTEVLVEARVPAGTTVLQALQREAEVETRFGGRFVQAIEGIEGGLEAQRDWFFFVNGIEPSLGAAEVTLRPGDVAWWDFRSWQEEMAQPVVVGAFPEPFLHGWEGRRRPAAVDHPPELAAEAEELLAVLGGTAGEGEPNEFSLVVVPGSGAALTARRGEANDSPVTFTLAGSLDAVRAAAAALARDPDLVRFRYEARFDESGQVVE